MKKLVIIILALVLFAVSCETEDHSQTVENVNLLYQDNTIQIFDSIDSRGDFFLKIKFKDRTEQQRLFGNIYLWQNETVDFN